MIAENKIKHSRAVAELMYSLASEEKKEQMYILGLLHDVGYMFGHNNHNKNGGNLLKESGYQYWQEVFYHGDCQPPYSSYELDLRNYADMPIGPDGTHIGFAKRLEDIEIRYGTDSKEYQNASTNIKRLKNMF